MVRCKFPVYASTRLDFWKTIRIAPPNCKVFARMKLSNKVSCCLELNICAYHTSGVMFLWHNGHPLSFRTWWPRNVWGTRATMEEQEGGRHHMATFFCTKLVEVWNFNSCRTCQCEIYNVHRCLLAYCISWKTNRKDMNQKYKDHKYLESTWTEQQSFFTIGGVLHIDFSEASDVSYAEQWCCESDLGDTHLISSTCRHVIY